MKRVAILIIGGVVLMVTMIVVIVTTTLDENECRPTIGVGKSTVGGDVPVKSGDAVKPLGTDVATFTSGFGERWGTIHQGIDLAAPAGTPFYAYTDGIVAEAGSAAGFGSWIVLDHNIDGQVVSTVYGHMYPDGVHVSTGDAVKAGQHIGDVGSAGQSTGPHLHWEVWPGGRLSGGTAIDPKEHYDSAPEPGQVTGTGGNKDAEPAEPVDADDVPPMPERMGSEHNWQRDTVRVARIVAHRWPELQTIGGYREWDAERRYPDHPEGRAADIMIPAWDTDEGIALGDAINDFVVANAEELNVTYTIWRGMYYPAGGTPSPYTEGNGDPTSEHYDHVHVSVVGGGMPDGSPVPGLGETPDKDNGDDCDGLKVYGPGGSLDPGTVPDGWARWFELSASQCEQMTPSLLAAQVGAESSFQPGLVSVQGAEGISQFMPATWASYGAEVNEDGEVIGEPGSGSQNDPGDAIMAQGRYMCAIAQQIDTWIAEGRVSAPNGQTELYLAGYNAGEHAVLRNGGFPTDGSDYFTETRPYVDKIIAAEPQYRGMSD